MMLRQVLYGFLFLSIFIPGCVMSQDSNYRCLNQILSRTERVLQSESGLYVIGESRSSNADGMLTRFDIALEIERALDEEDARPLVIKIARNFRNQINSHSCGAEYFTHYPVDEYDIGVQLFVSHRVTERGTPPHLIVASFSKGKLSYESNDDPDRYGRDDYVVTETLGEALQKLGETQF